MVLPQTLALAGLTLESFWLFPGFRPLLESVRLWNPTAGLLEPSITSTRAPLCRVGSPHRPAVLSPATGSLLVMLRVPSFSSGAFESCPVRLVGLKRTVIGTGEAPG